MGRRRLPDGFVAILDDQETLRGAIRELHAYSIQNRSPNRPRRGIIFRIVTDVERQAFLTKLERIFGPRNLSSQESIYGYPVGHFHFLDDSFMSHVTNRHSIESAAGHIAVGLDDLLQIPHIVNPRWIANFACIKQMPLRAHPWRCDDCRDSGNSGQSGIECENDLQEKIKVVGDIWPKDGFSTVPLYVQNEPACATTFLYYRRKIHNSQQCCGL